MLGAQYARASNAKPQTPESAKNKNKGNDQIKETTGQICCAKDGERVRIITKMTDMDDSGDNGDEKTYQKTYDSKEDSKTGESLGGERNNQHFDETHPPQANNELPANANMTDSGSVVNVTGDSTTEINDDSNYTGGNQEKLPENRDTDTVSNIEVYGEQSMPSKGNAAGDDMKQESRFDFQNKPSEKEHKNTEVNDEPALARGNIGRSADSQRHASSPEIQNETTENRHMTVSVENNGKPLAVSEDKGYDDNYLMQVIPKKCRETEDEILSSEDNGKPSPASENNGAVAVDQRQESPGDDLGEGEELQGVEHPESTNSSDNSVCPTGETSTYLWILLFVYFLAFYTDLQI